MNENAEKLLQLVRSGGPMDLQAALRIAAGFGEDLPFRRWLFAEHLRAIDSVPLPRWVGALVVNQPVTGFFWSAPAKDGLKNPCFRRWGQEIFLMKDGQTIETDLKIMGFSELPRNLTHVKLGFGPMPRSPEHGGSWVVSLDVLAADMGISL